MAGIDWLLAAGIVVVVLVVVVVVVVGEGSRARNGGESMWKVSGELSVGGREVGRFLGGNVRFRGSQDPRRKLGHIGATQKLGPSREAAKKCCQLKGSGEGGGV
jgi:hypothetical protein